MLLKLSATLSLLAEPDALALPALKSSDRTLLELSDPASLGGLPI